MSPTEDAEPRDLGAADGAYRAALARRLARLDADTQARLAPRLRPGLIASRTAPVPAASPHTATAPRPLAALLASMRAPPAAEAAAERSPWAGLSVQRELAQAAAARPDQAGPLNSHALALRTLQTLQRLAPGYLERLVAQLEALRWLEDARPRRR